MLKLLFLLSGLVVMVTIGETTAQVTNFGIAPVAGGQSLLYWPVSSTNYVLQTTTNLALANWVAASSVVTVNAVNVTNSAPSGFFRLLQSTNPPGMVMIPAGSFLMGNFIVNNFYESATNDPDLAGYGPTNVYVSAFYMDVNLVASNQWAAVYGYATANGYTFAHAGSAKAANHPIQTVDWYDCVVWCNARSVQAGLPPCYFADAGFTQVYTNAAGTNVYWNAANNGYRLPTEAEWEKAARGGLTGNRFPWGNYITESQANYPADPAGYDYDLNPYSGANTNFETGANPVTSPVGSFAPNGYGLYDMAGNVYEWCWDWFAYPPYPPGSPYLGGTDPRGPVGPLYIRVTRGGSLGDYAFAERCADRGIYGDPAFAGYTIGFRCVRGL